MIGAADQALAVALLGTFGRAGYQRAEPDILQPADIFLDVSGEDMRKRMFMTQDGDGREWCLRPEFTIPVCRAHLASAATGEAGAYAYLGPVFRMRSGESGEFLQAGIESIGRTDAEAADAEVLALTCEAAAAAGLASPQIRLGDVAVLRAALGALNLPASAQRRLMRAVGAGEGVAAAATLETPADSAFAQHSGLFAALQGQDPRAARDFVENVLSIAGISTVGGRTAGDIASRFLARASERDLSVSSEARRIIERLLGVSGDPDSCAAALRALAADAGLGLASELDALEARTGFIAARGLDIGAMRFDASFARNLDYYTSFIFELHDPSPGSPKPVAGGGRYDTLLGKLGAAEPTPAVGASIWLGRLVGRPA
ncbi:MAG: ATP phosphoribosyltransferase regulatory subunit [Bosea sp.]|nr:ATP phosphoribosyltransferase regulatory subunit [Bosea sp. (in: a-proteobacteria)]